MKKVAFVAVSAALVGCWSMSGSDKSEGPEAAEQPVQETEAVAHARKVSFARRLAANGIVLLKNEDGVLPLAQDREVVLLGFTSYYPHRMGWGSGDMLAHEPVPYDRGLEEAGIRLEPTFASLYRTERERRLEKGMYDRLNRDWWKWTSRFDEPELSGKAFDTFAAGVDRTLPCVVTIGRNAGEAEDLKDGRGSFRLHEQEKRLLEDACRNFDNVIVLLNTCGVIDTSFMDELPVKGLVHTSLLGEVSGLAVADVLSGRVSPSGKTVDTWAKHYYDYSTTDCFGTFEVPYREGSSVGYRHFDDKAIAPRYPFGFGLSYTTFEMEFGDASVDGTRVQLPVTVRNTGSCRGAEVVQAYFAHPERDPSVEPLKQLCAFAKTSALAAGASETVVLDFDVKDRAIYDEASASWVLTGGQYVVLVGGSSDTAAAAVALDLPRTIVSRTVNRFGEKRPAAKPAPALPETPFAVTVTMEDVLTGIATVDQVVAQFTDEELVSLVNGRIFNGGYAVSGGTGVGGVKKGRVDCEAGEFWSSEKYGIPALTCADGPSGVRLGNFGDPLSKFNAIAARMVSWPCATALAQGWDPKAAECFGRMVSEEMAAADIDGWLAPGVNIHRNPLCGRNFEYFSEDPLLAGKLGAAVVRGVQTKADGSSSGRYATVKHFCTNNQEYHRNEEMNIVSEKALREIYLKPFEIVVKESQPHALMSSYNQINGEFCAASASLLTGVLREEWGFKGLVMTDWWTISDKRRHPAAGNDVVMPGMAHEWEDLLAAVKAGKVARADLQRSAVRILNVVLNRMKAK